MNLYSHVGLAKSCKKDSRYPPLSTKRVATSGNMFKTNSFEEKKPDIQIQMLKLDNITGVVLEITYIGIMFQERNSMFRKTIFRYFSTTLMSRDKRKTKTSVDVLHEATIDDYWNIDGDISLSEPWIKVTRFRIAEQKTPEGIMWLQGRLTNKQVTRRLGNIGPEEWSSISKSSQRKAIKKWAREQRGHSPIPDDGPGCDEVVISCHKKNWR